MSKGIIAFLVLAFENKSINGSRGRLASQVSGKKIITINTLSIRLLGPQQFLKTFSQHDNNLNKSNFLSVPLFFLSIFIIPLRIQQRSKMHYKAKPSQNLYIALYIQLYMCSCLLNGMNVYGKWNYMCWRVLFEFFSVLHTRTSPSQVWIMGKWNFNMISVSSSWNLFLMLNRCAWKRT